MFVSLSVTMQRYEKTLAALVVKLSEYTDSGVKFARWQHPAVGREASFEVHGTICCIYISCGFT